MADYRNRDRDEYQVPDVNNNNNKKTTSSMMGMNYNRSMTINSTKPANEMTNKPLFNLYTSASFQRNGSIKTLGSSIGSMFSGNSIKGKVMKLRSMFEGPKYNTNPNPNPSPTPASIITQFPKKDPTLFLKANPEYDSFSNSIPPAVSDSPFRLPGTEDRVVIYFTSLRGIRRTFQDCHSVRMIFRGFRVNIDERDISMDAAYRKELQDVMGQKKVTLPQVFIKGKYIGGADVVKGLLEAGDLGKLMKGLPLTSCKPCEGCDDMRFMPCTNCDGSRKVFDEDEGQPKRCLECNENGLVRCPVCCY